MVLLLGIYRFYYALFYLLTGTDVTIHLSPTIKLYVKNNQKFPTCLLDCYLL